MSAIACPHMEALRARRSPGALDFQRMVEILPVAVMTCDLATFIIDYANAHSIALLHSIKGELPIDPDQIVGASIDIFHKVPPRQRALLSDPVMLPHKARIRLGEEWLDLHIHSLSDADGQPTRALLVWAVATAEVAKLEAEARIHQLAHYDVLTGLANRATFASKLRAAAAKEAKFALFLIDLDGFKNVNDTYGHPAGDRLLKQVGERLLLNCRSSKITIARLGGDEFAIILPNAGLEQATGIAGQIIGALASPFDMMDGRCLRVGGSIGIALSPSHGRNSESLLSRADMALYEAKASGKGVFRLFSPELEHRISEYMRLEGKLREALETKEGLFLHYQPIVDIATQKVTAREALMRFHHPKRGWIPPLEFIPVAEETGMILELGAWAIEQACLDAVSWQDGARVAVNVSPRQLGIGTLPSIVLAALCRSGLSPDRLEIEVTESAFLQSELDCMSDLRQLRAMGARVALDDFGTGFSSLAHLRAFPFDKIKIDGSFVRDATTRPNCAAIVGVVADLGRRLGVTTVAEGVETHEHLELVRSEGCLEVQGYLFGRPEPIARA